MLAFERVVLSMDSGKRMETSFRKCAMKVPGVYYKRMNDGTASYYGGQAQAGIRFQKSNDYDAIMHHAPILYLLEFKSHLGAALPFSKIRKNQLEALNNASRAFPMVAAGFVIHFVDKDECWFVRGDRVVDFVEAAERKSIPIAWCQENGLLIRTKKLKTNYDYDVLGFINEVEKQWL